MLPNVLQRSASDHVPVLAEEVRELLAVQPGETVVDATFGAGGHSRLLAADLQGDGQADRDRPRPVGAHLLRPLQGTAEAASGSLPARRVLARPQPAGRQRRPGRRDPARPRGLVDAARPAGARLLVRRRRAARHAHGHGGRALGARARQRGRRARARVDLQALRRGALRAPDRPGDRPPPRRAAVRAHDRPRRHDQAGDPDAGALRRRASRQAGLPGAPDRRQRRARRARGGAPGGGADAQAGRPHRRHQLPLARGPDREALHPRAGARLHVPAGVPDLRAATSRCCAT